MLRVLQGPYTRLTGMSRIFGITSRMYGRNSEAKEEYDFVPFLRNLTYERTFPL